MRSQRSCQTHAAEFLNSEIKRLKVGSRRKGPDTSQDSLSTNPLRPTALLLRGACRQLRGQLCWREERGNRYSQHIHTLSLSLHEHRPLDAQPATRRPRRRRGMISRAHSCPPDSIPGRTRHTSTDAPNPTSGPLAAPLRHSSSHIELDLPAPGAPVHSQASPPEHTRAPAHSPAHSPRGPPDRTDTGPGSSINRPDTSASLPPDTAQTPADHAPSHKLPAPCGPPAPDTNSQWSPHETRPHGLPTDSR